MNIIPFPNNRRSQLRRIERSLLKRLAQRDTVKARAVLRRVQVALAREVA